jgi:hypothetical protein
MERDKAKFKSDTCNDQDRSRQKQDAVGTAFAACSVSLLNSMVPACMKRHAEDQAAEETAAS